MRLARCVLVVLLLGTALSLSGADLPTTPEILVSEGVSGPMCSLSGAQSEDPTAGGLFPLCAPVNENGCNLSDIACTGYNCCCIYSCSAGTEVGPCYSTWDPPF